jgi:hypothetical protein
MHFFCGIIAGALLACCRTNSSDGRNVWPAPSFSVLTCSCGPTSFRYRAAFHSPLVAGYLFEVPLAGILMGQIGIVAASIGASIAIGRFVPAGDAREVLVDADRVDRLHRRRGGAHLMVAGSCETAATATCLPRTKR